MSDLLARLIAAGTPADLVAEVALELARAEAAQEAIDRRRASDRGRSARHRNVTSRDVTGDSVTERDEPALSRPPNEINSNPPTHTHPEINTTREEPIFHVEAWRRHQAELAAAKPKRTKGIRTIGVDHPMPDDWEPALTDRAQKIVDGWPPGMWARELSKFRNHAADKGRLSKNWQAAFRTWIDNAEERRMANGNANIRRSIGPSPDRRSSLAQAIDEGLEWLG